jgi:hypothetical protein
MDRTYTKWIVLGFISLVRLIAFLNHVNEDDS